MNRILTAVTALSICTAGIAAAQDYSANLKARQGQFRILAINLGTLGAMAKGEVDYDADAATAFVVIVRFTPIEATVLALHRFSRWLLICLASAIFLSKALKPEQQVIFSRNCVVYGNKLKLRSV